MKPKIKQIGFTLVELLLVIALIVILVSMVLIATNRSRVNSEEHLTRATIELLDAALQEYYDYWKAFPVQIDRSINTAGRNWIGHSEYLYAELYRIPSSRKLLGKIPSSGNDQNMADSMIRDTDNDEIWEVCDRWKTALNYIYDPTIDTFPLIISAGPDRDFDRTVDNIDNKR